MTWAKLDDSILDNKKIGKAGVIGFALHVAGITWCSRNLTDGVIPLAAARRLLDFSDALQEPIDLCSAPESWKQKASEATADLGVLRAEDVAERLIEVGLWEHHPEGYRVHDYLKYNPSKAEIESLRAARQASGSKGGKVGRKAKDEANGKQTLKRNESKAEAKKKLARVGAPVHAPVCAPASEISYLPVPVPVPRRESDAREARDPPPVQESASEIRMLTARQRPEVKAFESSFQQVPRGVDTWDGPGPEHHERAEAGKLDVAEVSEEFRFYHRSSGKVSCDWGAEFSRWLLREVRIRAERSAHGQKARTGSAREDPDERRRIRSNLFDDAKCGTYGKAVRVRAETLSGQELRTLLDELERGAHKRLELRSTAPQLEPTADGRVKFTMGSEKP